MNRLAKLFFAKLPPKFGAIDSRYRHLILKKRQKIGDKNLTGLCDVYPNSTVENDTA